MIIDRNSPIPQYFQLQTWLIEQIDQGVFKTGDKIPTEEELAQITGLARATIRQAVQNLVHIGYLIRKKRLGTFVIERQVDTEKKPMIGILLPDIRTGYAPILARGAEDEAARSNYSLILCNTDDLFVKADFHANRLIENAVSGMIFIPTAAEDERNRQIVEKFNRNNIPVVLADRTIPDTDADYVTTDNFEGAYNLTEYLIKKGHKRIGISLSDQFSTERDRLAGYKRALIDNNLAIDPEIILIHRGPFVEKPYLQHARILLKRSNEVSAIFAGHDRIAFVVYALAEQMNLSIPDQVSLVGYDDLQPSCAHMVSLTTMHQPIYEMGQESMKLIVSRISDPNRDIKRIVLKSVFKDGGSVSGPGI